MILSHIKHVVTGYRTDEKKQIESFLITAIFALVLTVCFGLTCFDCLTGTNDVVSKNRFPTSFPHGSIFSNNPSAYIKEIEKFVSDRFSFRHNLVASRNWLLCTYLQSSGNSDILFGNDDFMFLSVPAALFAQTHAKAFSPDELACAADNFMAKSQWLQSHGISSVLMVVPEKGTLYPEKLPGSVSILPSDSRLDVLRNEITQKNICTFFDAKEALSKAKTPDHYLFRRFDSHWNEEGAVTVLRKLCASLNLAVPPLNKTTVSLADGDLAKMIALGDSFHESEPMYEFEHRTARNIIFVGKSPTGSSVKFAKYENRAPANDVKIFVIGDSFSHLLMKFIPELASESSFQFFREFSLYWHHFRLERISRNDLIARL